MIECIRFKSHQKGYLQGFADFYIEKWGVEIPGFTLWMKDGKRWINAPSVKYVDKDGQEKNRSFFYFRNKDHWNAFVEAGKQAIDKFCAENPENSPGNPDSSQNYEDECPF